MPTLVMTPATGSSVVRHVGDRLHIQARLDGDTDGDGWRFFVRTDLGTPPRRGADWRAAARWTDLPMGRDGDGWVADIPCTRTGFFQAKVMALDPQGNRHWASGADLGISIHPDAYRNANTIYCAFPRMFGQSRFDNQTKDPLRDEQLRVWDRHGWTVIPPSGTFRDFAAQVPHIVERLGCRIIHLLPINPTPTTHARYGRFGSPYAATDFTSVDPALVEHDRETTGLQQFDEMVEVIHGAGARLIIDLAINHTGWNSTLQNEHPEWFARDDESTFVSPGAWGTVWEDLSELDHGHEALWHHLAEVFLFWCRRGVDGFRCDAGYMVPLPAWRVICNRVREEFPDALFLLEGLGGGWDDTARLLGPGGMQWAYSELFQNYSGREVASYLDHAIRASDQTGLLVHYSETHDNNRLAARFPDEAKGRRWSLLRNRLCALTSVRGGFGFTCGVEWLAREKLEVHQSRGLNWGADDNLIEELATLNTLLAEHPCFLDGSTITRLSADDSAVLLLERQAEDGSSRVLIAANTDPDDEGTLPLSAAAAGSLGLAPVDLLGAKATGLQHSPDGEASISLPPGGVVCLAGGPWDRNKRGSSRRTARACASTAIQVLAEHLPLSAFGPASWEALGERFHADPLGFCAKASAVDKAAAGKDLLAAVDRALTADHYPRARRWTAADSRRVSVIPTGHWLVVCHDGPFRARLEHNAGALEQRSIATATGHVAVFAPRLAGEASIALRPADAAEAALSGKLRYSDGSATVPAGFDAQGLALLTNGRGGMARLPVDFGSVTSKYDAVLAANLHGERPVDRQVLLKRLRAYVDADGFVSPLNGAAVTSFTCDGNSASWRFRVGAGAGRHIELGLWVWMRSLRNEVVFAWQRLGGDRSIRVGLILRPDVEDRSFHQETTRSPAAEAHFRQHTAGIDDGAGFLFSPAEDRQLRVLSSKGGFKGGEEWSSCDHPLEATRGQRANGDTWSPGWFSIPLAHEEELRILVSAESEPYPIAAEQRPEPGPWQGLEQRLRGAVDAYLVEREGGKTVIAGYPWFLDWGRDTLICARGYLAAGRDAEVRELLQVFGRFEEKGTLPNIIHGGAVGNRDTVDAPLWYAVVAEELATRNGPETWQLPLGDGRTLSEALASIASGYLAGTSNGITVDPISGLVWSPSHFTWMDTNYPAGTPREGYPIEIQALWIRLLRCCQALGLPGGGEAGWGGLADLAAASFDRLFWLPDLNRPADCLIAGSGVSAAKAIPDTAMRSNAALAVALDIWTGERAQATVQATADYLVIPGALRSLADLPVAPELAVRDARGKLLNDPVHPYAGRYQGDEDSSRKPAYHNGTAWTWPFPNFCEALVKAWPDDPAALRAAQAYLATVDGPLERGCIGHLPEIIDGDAPHRPRGCDAQAWGDSEALRVWLWLQERAGA